MEWKCKLTDNGWRCFNEEGQQFGDWYQAQIRTPEWKSALIVFEKYKRKYNLEHNDLLQLKNYLIDFAEERKAQGKKCGNDYLTQIASAELKLRFRGSSQVD